MKIKQFLCEKLKGHHYTGREWGFGGEYVDLWCHYCGKMTSLPTQEAQEMFPEIFADIRAEMFKLTGSDIRMGILDYKQEK